MSEGLRSIGLRVAVGTALAVFYLLSASENHSTALDSYGFAHWITETPITAVPELRYFLWVVAMQALYSAASWVVSEPDPFVLVGTLGAIETAMAVILLERLLSRRFGLSAAAAWTGALGFAVSYGVWRFAAEFELYAAAALMSVALVYAAFGLEGRERAPSAWWIVGLAAAGGLATLAYQPLGIVAGFAIPAYLVARLSLGRVALYYVVSGVVVLGGLLVANLMSGTDPEGLAVGSILDTDGKPAVLPGAVELARSFVALVHNLLSINWSFAFEPTRAIYEAHTGRWYAIFLYPAQFAPRTYLVFLATLPLAGALTVAALVLARRSPVRRPFGAMEAAVLVWLAGQAAMVLAIDPLGLEPWVPSMLPIFILVGVRLFEPMVHQARGTHVGVALVLVFLVHNWFAGLAVMQAAEHNVRDLQAAPIVPTVGPEDLMVVGEDWSFRRYLDYRTDTPVIELPYVDGARATALIEETLAQGGKVVLFDDVMALPGDRAVLDPAFAEEFQEIGRTRLGEARRIDLPHGGYAFEILPPGRP